MNTLERGFIAQIRVNDPGLQRRVHVRIPVIILILASGKEFEGGLFHVGARHDADLLPYVVLVGDLMRGLGGGLTLLSGKTGKDCGEDRGGDQDAEDDLVCAF